MRKSTILPLVFVVLGMLAIWGVYKYLPVFHSKLQQKTSDAKDLKGKINVAVDDWIGYAPLSSGRMKKQMRSEGFVFECVNDGANYKKRMEDLTAGKYDFVVATVDSYLLNAAAVSFPGTIIAIIDESHGADAMVGYTNEVANLDAFKSVRNFKIAYTAGSPSHHLLKAVASHFNVPALKKLRPDQKLETDDSQQALKLFTEKKASVAILWEPNVSKALEIPGVGRILGTENTSHVIVDILVVNRDFATKHPEQVDLVLKTYFRVLKFYSDNPEDLKKEIHVEQKLPMDSIQKMLDGVLWVNLSDNCLQWFGINGPGQISEQGLVDTIGSTVSILVESGDFKDDPLPDKDPYRIINSSFVQTLYKSGVRNGFANLDTAATAVVAGETSLSRVFKPLSDSQWQKLRPVGSIRVDPIKFQTGLYDLDVAEKEKLDAAVERLKHYPSFRIMVMGHTSSLGDQAANLALSQERANAVGRYLAVTYNIDENRVKAIGFGGSKPLPRQPDESEGSYQKYRLPRVEIELLSESY